MTRWWCAAMALMMMATLADAQQMTITLGTATPGGGFPVYGEAFKEVMQATDPSLTITLRNTKGSAENIPLLEAGQLDIALVAGEPAYEAFAGIGRPAAPAADPPLPRHRRTAAVHGHAAARGAGRGAR